MAVSSSPSSSKPGATKHRSSSANPASPNVASSAPCRWIATWPHAQHTHSTRSRQVAHRDPVRSRDCRGGVRQLTRSAAHEDSAAVGLCAEDADSGLDDDPNAGLSRPRTPSLRASSAPAASAECFAAVCKNVVASSRRDTFSLRSEWWSRSRRLTGRDPPTSAARRSRSRRNPRRNLASRLWKPRAPRCSSGLETPPCNPRPLAPASSMPSSASPGKISHGERVADWHSGVPTLLPRLARDRACDTACTEVFGCAAASLPSALRLSSAHAARGAAAGAAVDTPCFAGSRRSSPPGGGGTRKTRSRKAPTQTIGGEGAPKAPCSVACLARYRCASASRSSADTPFR